MLLMCYNYFGDNMYNNINLNTLKYFYEIANTKNITKASNNLNISQPALTKSLKVLEEDLNITLFTRSKKGVLLTDEGEILYEYTKKMFQNLSSTLNVLDESKEQGGHLYIGATTTNFLEPILSTLDEFRKLYPNIKIEIVLEEINVLEKYNKLGKLDILIKNSYEKIDNCEIIKSFTIQDRFIASKKQFIHLENKILSLNELLKEPFVLLSRITHGRRNFDSYLKSQNISFKPAYEFNSYSLCRELIKNGFGIGVGNPIHYQTDDFIILKTDFELPIRSFDICYIKSSKNKTINNFINLIKK